jgi:uncharacterized membrane protein
VKKSILSGDCLLKTDCLVKNFFRFPFALFAIGIANVQHCLKPQNICAVFSEKYAIYIGLIIAMFVALSAGMLCSKVF